MKRTTPASQKELIKSLEKESGEEVKTLEQWLEYIINRGVNGQGALTMKYFFAYEIDSARKVRDELKPISNRLYVTKSAMAEQLKLVVECNKYWRKRMLSLKDYDSKQALYQNSLNNIVVLTNRQDDIL